MCDRLLAEINSLRLSWPSSKDAGAVHTRIWPLQCTLKELNNAQASDCACACAVAATLLLLQHAV